MVVVAATRRLVGVDFIELTFAGHSSRLNYLQYHRFSTLRLVYQFVSICVSFCLIWFSNFFIFIPFLNALFTCVNGHMLAHIGGLATIVSFSIYFYLTHLDCKRLPLACCCCR